MDQSSPCAAAHIAWWLENCEGKHMKAKTWLVTGCSSGLGRAIADAVLENGDNLVATARDTQQLADLSDIYRDRVSLVTLDVRSAQTAGRAVLEAVDQYGALDVLVNNAGFSVTAAFEHTSAEQFDAQIDTNFFGVVNLMRAAIPVMRRQRSGRIINISSAAGRVGMASQSAYCAAKSAVNGLTEAVAQEVAGFGVKVIAVEPGSMRTNFGNVTIGESPEPDAQYDASVGAFLRTLQLINGKEVGDIIKIAKIIISLARKEDIPSHLILGSDALAVIRAGEKSRDAMRAEWEAVSRSSDADDADLSWLDN
jgi:NAD(P)-dependent dehydrogenase (short-subunit alcohol dehydrogenase family)